jgi:4-aminobutyrate aminotransferase
MPGVFVAPYPYAYRYGWSEEQTTRFCLEELEFLLVSQTAPQETAAILIEPVLGEGGYIVPPVAFMKGLREICDRHGILLITDEVQSGFGRTGKWFAFEHFGIVPDIMTVAKGIASGLPLSGVFSCLDLMKKWQTGTHGGTYGGNALACAAGVATIRAMRDENMLENARWRGEQLISHLRHLQMEFPIIGDVRGVGLMIATEFRTLDHQPDKPTTKAVVHACEERNLLLLTCGSYDNVIRWIPPLIVNEQQIEDAVSIFTEALMEVVK